MQSGTRQYTGGKGAWASVLMCCLICFSLLITILSVPAHADDLTAIISMKAQHADNDYWEQWNPGLSLELRNPTSGPLHFTWSAGSIRDSLGNWSPHAAFGLHHQYDDWSFGLRATLLYRQRNVDGRKVGLKFAPLPTLEYMGESIGIGFVFIPQPTSDQKDSSALLMQLRMPL